MWRSSPGQVEPEREVADRRRKPLKPPGRRPPPRRAAAAVKAETSAKAEVAFSIPLELRKSSRASAVGAAERLRAVQGERERERERRRVELERRRASSVPTERPSQETMLVEAAQTEKVNKLSLQLLLEREERQRQKLEGRGRFVGPVLRQRSVKNDRGEEATTLAFLRGAHFPQRDVLAGDAPQASHQCAVFGGPARYRAPLTGLPYSSAEAFKILRQQHEDRKKGQKRRAEAESEEGLASGAATTAGTAGKLTLKVKLVAESKVPGSQAASALGGVQAPRQLPLPSGRAPKLLHYVAAPP